jgi:hypothetical protein
MRYWPRFWPGHVLNRSRRARRRRSGSGGAASGCRGAPRWRRARAAQPRSWSFSACRLMHDLVGRDLKLAWGGGRLSRCCVTAFKSKRQRCSRECPSRGASARRAVWRLLSEERPPPIESVVAVRALSRRLKRGLPCPATPRNLEAGDDRLPRRRGRRAPPANPAPPTPPHDLPAAPAPTGPGDPRKKQHTVP